MADGGCYLNNRRVRLLKPQIRRCAHAFTTTDQAALQEATADAAPDLLNALTYRITVKRILARQLEMAERAIAFVQVGPTSDLMAYRVTRNTQSFSRSGSLLAGGSGQGDPARPDLKASCLDRTRPTNFENVLTSSIRGSSHDS